MAAGHLTRRSLPREADLRVADPVDGACPDGIRAAGAVDRHRLEIEQLAIAAAPGSLGADRSDLHPTGSMTASGVNVSLGKGSVQLVSQAPRSVGSQVSQ